MGSADGELQRRLAPQKQSSNRASSIGHDDGAGGRRSEEDMTRAAGGGGQRTGDESVLYVENQRLQALKEIAFCGCRSGTARICDT